MACHAFFRMLMVMGMIICHLPLPTLVNHTDRSNLCLEIGPRPTDGNPSISSMSVLTHASCGLRLLPPVAGRDGAVLLNPETGEAAELTEGTVRLHFNQDGWAYVTIDKGDGELKTLRVNQLLFQAAATNADGQLYVHDPRTTNSKFKSQLLKEQVENPRGGDANRGVPDPGVACPPASYPVERHDNVVGHAGPA